MTQKPYFALLLPPATSALYRAMEALCDGDYSRPIHADDLSEYLDKINRAWAESAPMARDTILGAHPSGAWDEPRIRAALDELREHNMAAMGMPGGVPLVKIKDPAQHRGFAPRETPEQLQAMTRVPVGKLRDV